MTKINLFCLPFAGGSKYSYKGYSNFAPNNLNVIPIEIPGRGSRYKDKLLTNLHEMVDDIYGNIFNKLGDPYAIYGHSMGTLLAYLLTKKIIANGLPQPLNLFVSGSGGPSVRENESRHLLPKKEFISKIKELGGSPDEILNDSELMNFFEPILRSDFQAVETYIFEESNDVFHIPINVFIGTEEKTTCEEALTWQKVTTAKVELRQFAGKHFFIFDFEREIMNIISNELTPKSSDDKNLVSVASSFYSSNT